MRVLAAGLLIVSALSGEDWPQWGGPKRNFQLASGKVPEWPASGPREIWSRDLGEGYSSMLVSGEVLYTMYRKQAQDVVIALNKETGQTKWETGIDAPHRSGMNTEAGPGPNSTPLIVRDRIFATTVTGRLVSLDRQTGRILWSHDLWKEYGGTLLERGYSASPLAYRDSVIVPVGGEGHALIAFRQADGAVLWSGGNFRNAYSSPIVIRAGGREQVVSFMAEEVTGVDAGNGQVIWTIAHQTMSDINAATPAWCEDIGVLVVSSAYDGGARGIRVTSSQAQELWAHKRLRVHHTNMTCAGNVVYGSSGDFGPAPFSAVDAATGKILWQDRSFSKASFILARDRVFLVDDDGSVAEAKVSREGLTVLGEAQLLRANAWTVPVLSGSTLFVRDRHKLIALSLE